jgi:sirohydrochlorin cobaltochelatase
LQYNTPATVGSLPLGRLQTAHLPEIPQAKRGLLLVGHGTRDQRGLAEFQAVAQQVAELAAGLAVQACYLEIAEPNIPTAVRRLLDSGVRHLTVAPLLLFAAGHALRDIPEAVEAVVGGQGSGVRGQEAQPLSGRANGPLSSSDLRPPTSDLDSKSVVINYLPPLEDHPRVIDLSVRRFQESLAGRPVADPADTLLLMVGRGSSYPEAIGKMHLFAQLAAARIGVGKVDCCFVAIAKPTLAEGLELAASSKFRRIVVQPHLLFVGQVLDEIEKAVAEIKAEGGKRKAESDASLLAASLATCSQSSEPEIANPRQEWIIAPHLGPSPEIAEAVLDLMHRAGC